MPQLSILTLMPTDTPEYMRDAWLCCVLWAAAEPGLVRRFREETGCRWTPGRRDIEQRIDAATGADDAFVRQWVEWVNTTVWGPIDGDPED